MSRVHLQLEDEGAPPFAGSVIEILNATLPPGSPTSPDEAAAALDALCSRECAEQDGAGSFLWWFWDLVHDLARQAPYDSPEQDRLAAVVKALADLPPRTVSLGEGWGGVGGSQVQLWMGLPMFANTFRERLDDGDARASGDTQRKERHVNLQAYAARVAGLGLVPFEVYAIWALVDALEGTMTPIRGAPDEVNDDPAAVQDVSYKVSSAAAWMIHAGCSLHGRDEEIRGATAGPLWRLDKKEAIRLRRQCRGTNGLCPQRWDLWKERFAAVRDSDGLESKVRKEAGDAFTSMDRVEMMH